MHSSPSLFRGPSTSNPTIPLPFSLLLLFGDIFGTIRDQTTREERATLGTEAAVAAPVTVIGLMLLWERAAVLVVASADDDGENFVRMVTGVCPLLRERPSDQADAAKARRHTKYPTHVRACVPRVSCCVLPLLLVHKKNPICEGKRKGGVGVCWGPLVEAILFAAIHVHIDAASPKPIVWKSRREAACFALPLPSYRSLCWK